MSPLWQILAQYIEYSAGVWGWEARADGNGTVMNVCGIENENANMILWRTFGGKDTMRRSVRIHQ